MNHVRKRGSYANDGVVQAAAAGRYIICQVYAAGGVWQAMSNVEFHATCIYDWMGTGQGKA